MNTIKFTCIGFLLCFFLRTKSIIEFELKDFNKVVNQNKEIEAIESAEYEYGEYNWWIKADVKKYKHQRDEDLWLIFFLQCESDDETDFPLFANIKYSILNKDKDSRKDLFKCN